MDIQTDIQIRPLKPEECPRIREIDASHYIARAWRVTDGALRLITLDYAEPDFPEGRVAHIARMRETLQAGGLALGAFFADRLVGFATVNAGLFGDRISYLLLDQLFVSRECRGHGIGTRLLYAAGREARRRGAERLYLCAGSSENTVAFYRAAGCRDAEEVQQALYEADPRDLQLELELSAIPEPGDGAPGHLLRALEARDLAPCAAILQAVYNNDLWQCHWQPETAVRYLSEYFTDSHFVGFVCEKAGAIIGAAFAHTRVWWNCSELVLDELFVAPQCQRRGIGTSLLGELEAYVCRNALAGIVLCTNRNACAPAFYRKHGFADCEQLLNMFWVP